MPSRSPVCDLVNSSRIKCLLRFILLHRSTAKDAYESADNGLERRSKDFKDFGVVHFGVKQTGQEHKDDGGHGQR